MRTLTIAAIKQLENKEPIPSFTGRITKVYEQKSDTGEYGPWWLQNLVVQDETGEVKVTWGGEDPFEQSAEGKTWSFECSETKHGLKGVSWEVRTKNGKTYESVKVTPSAKIKVLGGGERTPGEAENPLTGRDDPPPNPTKRTYPSGAGPEGIPSDADWPEATPKPQLDDGVAEARKHIMQSANLYVLCVNAVEKYCAAHFPEVARTSEQFQAAVGTLFIEASSRRTTDGVNWWSYVDKMPQSPIK